MTPQEQRENDIFHKAQKALRDGDSVQLIQALPGGRPGSVFHTSVSLIGHALSVGSDLKGFKDYLALTQSELKASGFSEEDIYYWTKGVVSGLQSLIAEAALPLVTEAFEHRTF